MKLKDKIILLEFLGYQLINDDPDAGEYYHHPQTSDCHFMKDGLEEYDPLMFQGQFRTLWNNLNVHDRYEALGSDKLSPEQAANKMVNFIPEIVDNMVLLLKNTKGVGV